MTTTNYFLWRKRARPISEECSLSVPLKKSWFVVPYLWENMTRWRSVTLKMSTRYKDMRIALTNWNIISNFNNCYSITQRIKNNSKKRNQFTESIHPFTESMLLFVYSLVHTQLVECIPRVLICVLHMLSTTMNEFTHELIWKWYTFWLHTYSAHRATKRVKYFVVVLYFLLDKSC